MNTMCWLSKKIHSLAGQNLLELFVFSYSLSFESSQFRVPFLLHIAVDRPWKAQFKTATMIILNICNNHSIHCPFAFQTIPRDHTGKHLLSCRLSKRRPFVEFDIFSGKSFFFVDLLPSILVCPVLFSYIAWNLLLSSLGIVLYMLIMLRMRKYILIVPLCLLFLFCWHFFFVCLRFTD